MAEENKQQVQTWKDVHISPELSASMLIDFFNILNQRMATLENIVTIPDNTGKMITVTELYARQAQAQAQAEAQKAQQSKDAEEPKGE